MSSTLFLAFCILGCDLLLYILFQWTYGEKRRGLANRRASRLSGAASAKSQPLEFVPAKRKPASAGRPPASGSLELQRQEKSLEKTWQGGGTERRAYQRIVTSFARAKS